MVSLYNHLARIIVDGFAGIPPGNALLKTLDDFPSIRERLDPHTREFLHPLGAVGFPDNLLLRYIDQTPCQVTGVRGSKRRIRKPLARTVRGDKVLEYVKTLAEIRLDRQLDGLTRSIRHQPAHPGKLLNLFLGTTRAGVRHHIDIVVLVKTGEKLVCNLIIRFLPGFNHCLVALFLRHQPAPEVLRDAVNSRLRLRDNLLFCRRHRHIRNGYRHGGERRIFVTHGFDCIKRFRRRCCTVGINTFLKDFL